jgi:Cu-Zn family superoxide dismutase
MPRFRTALSLAAVLGLGITAGGASARDDHDHGDRHDRHHGKRAHIATAALRNAQGDKVGKVWMRESRRSDTVQLLVTVRDLTPGFHGFHVHTTGRCDPPGFTTAGGHLNPSGATHGAHAGDLPSLLVNSDGSGLLATATDRFSLDDLRDSDGSAVMVHSGPDNFANIPPRYGAPDQETLNTGDSGTRVACGVVR